MVAVDDKYDVVIELYRQSSLATTIFLFSYRSSQTHFLVFLMNSLNFDCSYAESVWFGILRS